MVASFPPVAPRRQLRFAARCLTLILTIALVVTGTPQFAHAQDGAIRKEYYRGGNTHIGEFGGFSFDPGPSEIRGGMSLGMGKGLELGCGGLNIMDYMKASFNVSDIMEQGKAMLQSMLAKTILIQLMAVPYISSALGMLQETLNAGFSLFNASCDMGEIRSKAKDLLTARCQAMHPGDDAAIIRCTNWGDSMKATMKSELGKLNESLDLFNQDPLGQLRNTFCESGTHQGAEVCAIMAFMPRLCVNTPLGSGCTGGTSRRPPVTAAAVSALTQEFTHTTMDRCAQVWDNIREVAPDIDPATIREISNRAARLANMKAFDERGSGAGASLTPAPGANRFALMNTKMLTTVYGDPDPQSSEETLKKYRNFALKGCAPQVRDDPLRMCRYIAESARELLGPRGGAIDTNVTIAPEDIVDPSAFFDDMPREASAATRNLGIDGETAAKMMSETFSCEANGQGSLGGDNHITSPAFQAAIATGDYVLKDGQRQTMSWDNASRWMGKRLSCRSVELLYTFLIQETEEARTRFLSSESFKTPNSVANNAEGWETTVQGGELEKSVTEPGATAAYSLAQRYFLTQLESNRVVCGTLTGRNK